MQDQKKHSTYIADLRADYTKSTLDISDVHENPFIQFQQWFDFAFEQKALEANAFALSTVDEFNRPHTRIVLLKDILDNGIRFFTNYQSNKSKEMQKNQFVSACFFWPSVERQVRIEGIVKKCSEEISEEYFNSRPKISKAGAIVSNQSEIIATRAILDNKMEELMKMHEQELKRPKHWGGFDIYANYLEFWQGRSGRVHDRICYEKNEHSWKIFRRSP